MTNSHPPRLAVALLDCFVQDSALIGDLIEEFRQGRSGLWFWRQALCATLTDSVRRSPATHPLQIGTPASTVLLANVRSVSRKCDTRIRGIDSVGLIASAVLMATLLPGLWWFVLYGVLCGAVLGVALIVIRRRHLV